MNLTEPKPQMWLQDAPDREPDRVAMRPGIRQRMGAPIDVAIGDAFAFDGAWCDRIVVAVLALVAADRGSPMG